jgi:hypothetical protein
MSEMNKTEKIKLAIEKLEEARELMADAFDDEDFLQNHIIFIDTMIDEIGYYMDEELENE